MVIKYVKLNKRHFKKLPGDLLIEFGLVNGQQAFPSSLYFSEADAKKYKKSLAERARNETPYYSKRAIQQAVAMEWLNLGPNDQLAPAIKEGYALIIIEEQKNEE